MFRICLIPVFLYLLLYMPGAIGAVSATGAADTIGASGAYSPLGTYLAVAVFIIASLSDALDGYIARKYNLITNFGKLMDPLADKLLVCAALVAMVELALIPTWVAVVIISREFIITGFRQIAVESGFVMAAGSWGKLKTISQMVMIIFVLLFRFNPIPIANIVLIGIATIFTVGSAVEYIYMNRGLLKH